MCTFETLSVDPCRSCQLPAQRHIVHSSHASPSLHAALRRIDPRAVRVGATMMDMHAQLVAAAKARQAAGRDSADIDRADSIRRGRPPESDAPL